MGLILALPLVPPTTSMVSRAFPGQRIDNCGAPASPLSPSIIPNDRLDRDIYLMLEDFGARAGCAWRETDEVDTGLETVLQD